jgi:hypothetical protein
VRKQNSVSEQFAITICSRTKNYIQKPLPNSAPCKVSRLGSTDSKPLPTQRQTELTPNRYQKYCEIAPNNAAKNSQQPFRVVKPHTPNMQKNMTINRKPGNN